MIHKRKLVPNAPVVLWHKYFEFSKGELVSDHWLKMITLDDIEAALCVLEADLAYMSGWEKDIIGGGLYSESHSQIKEALEMVQDQKKAWLNDPKNSPFADPQKAKAFLKNKSLKDTKLYKKVKRSTETPPGGGEGGGKDSGGGGGGWKPPNPDLTVPGGGMGINTALKHLSKWASVGSGAAGSSTSGFATLTTCLAGLFTGGTVVGTFIAVTAKSRADQASKKAKAANRSSELSDYFAYLAEWAGCEMRNASNARVSFKPSLPLKFEDWLNRRPPKMGI